MEKRGISKVRGFTLVELIVVIAIIMILIAILLPALISARQQAQQVLCQANLKQLGMGMTLYTQQYQYFPVITAADSPAVPGAGAYSWPVMLRNSLAGSGVYQRSFQKVFYCPAQDSRSQWDLDNAGYVKYAREEHTNIGYQVGERLLIGFAMSSSGGVTTTYPNTWFSYGLNSGGYRERNPSDPMVAYGMGGVYIANFDQPQSKWKISNVDLKKAKSVKSPSEFLIIADAVADTGNLGIGPFLGPFGIPAIHRRGLNLLFLDGHVEWHRQSDVVCEYPPIRQEASKQRRWNYDHKPSRVEWD